MEQTTPVPAIFTPIVDANEIVAVHDYRFHSTVNQFDYVTTADVNQRVRDVPPLVVRPIISPGDILFMLDGQVCVCGAAKPSRRSHCKKCYYTLPPDRRSALYRRFRAGYEQAFLKSLIVLLEAGRTTVDGIRAFAKT